MEDDSNIYFGQINQFNIRLRDYTIPLGYQYLVSLPATGNDTTAYYFFNLIDQFNHEQNTTIFSFYADGKAPTVQILSPTSTQFDANQSATLNVTISVNDKGGIFLVELYYKIDNSSSNTEWNIISLRINATTGEFTFMIPVTTENGTVFFKVRVYDNVGYSTSSTEHMFSYTNANPSANETSTKKSGGNNLVTWVVGGAILVAVGGGVVVAISKLNKSGKLTAVKSRIISKKPPGN